MSTPDVPVPLHLTTFIAFDFGLKRTGVAVGNRLLKTAQPQGSIHAEGSARFDGVAAKLNDREINECALVLQFRWRKSSR